MKNLKQNLIDEAATEITAKENDIKMSDEELTVLGARLKESQFIDGELNQ